MQSVYGVRIFTTCIEKKPTPHPNKRVSKRVFSGIHAFRPSPLFDSPCFGRGLNEVLLSGMVCACKEIIGTGTNIFLGLMMTHKKGVEYVRKRRGMI